MSLVHAGLQHKRTSPLPTTRRPLPRLLHKNNAKSILHPHSPSRPVEIVTRRAWQMSHSFQANAVKRCFLAKRHGGGVLFSARLEPDVATILESCLPRTLL